MRSVLIVALGLSVAFSASLASAAKLEFRNSKTLASANLTVARDSFEAAVKESEQADDIDNGNAMNLKVVAFKIISKKVGEKLESTIKQALYAFDRDTTSVEVKLLKDPNEMNSAFDEVMGELSWNNDLVPDRLASAIQEQLDTSNPTYVVKVESNQTYSTLLALVDQKTQEVLLIGLDLDI